MTAKGHTTVTPKVPVISVLNMKGGVGKTTISAHVFKHFFVRLRKETLLIDFDPQFNLTQTILDQDTYEDYKNENRTILRVLEGTQTESIYNVSASTEKIISCDDVSVGLRILKKSKKKLRLIPGNFDMVKYSLIDDGYVLKNAKKRFLQFIKNSQEECEIICIDCNPSSSFMTQCAILASTHILVPVKPDKYSMLGLKHLLKYIDDFHELKEKPKIVVLINNASKNFDNDGVVERELRGDPQIGAKILANTLRYSKHLSAQSGYTGFATDRRGPYLYQMTSSISSIVDELANILGMKYE